MEGSLGTALVAADLISAAQLETALEAHRSSGGMFGEVITNLGYVSDGSLTAFVAAAEGLPVADLDDCVFPIHLVSSIPRRIIEKHLVLPMARKNGVLKLAMADPTDYEAIEEVQLVTGHLVEVHLASIAQMRSAIGRVFEEIDTGSSPLLTPVDSSGRPRAVAKKPEAKRPASESLLQSLTPRKRWETLAPALIPLLIDKGMITDEELLAKFQSMKHQ